MDNTDSEWTETCTHLPEADRIMELTEDENLQGQAALLVDLARRIANHEAGVDRLKELVDQLADVLGKHASLLAEIAYRGTDGELYFERADDGLLLEGGAAAVVEAKAALVAAGRIES